MQSVVLRSHLYLKKKNAFDWTESKRSATKPKDHGPPSVVRIGRLLARLLAPQSRRAMHRPPPLLLFHRILLRFWKTHAWRMGLADAPQYLFHQDQALLCLTDCIKTTSGPSASPSNSGTPFRPSIEIIRWPRFVPPQKQKIRITTTTMTHVLACAAAKAALRTHSAEQCSRDISWSIEGGFVARAWCGQMIEGDAAGGGCITLETLEYDYYCRAQWKPLSHTHTRRFICIAD